MNQKQKKESIERMGSMMLQGWRMLAECCPICTSPLMSKGDNMRCPGCDMPIKFMTEDEEEALLSKQASNQSLKDRMPLSEQSEVSLIADSKVSTPAAFVDEQITVDSINSFEEMKRDYDLKNASRAKTTTKLGEYMLQGWTLLGDLCLLNSCVGTPLMEHDGYILCVSCNAEYLRCPDGEIVDKKAASLSPHNSTDKTSPLDSASKSSSRQEDDFVDDGLPILNFHRNEEASDNDVSSKIAAKLMRGWALLDEACPLDNVPLMRDKNGKKHCVLCDGTKSVALKTSTPFSLPEKKVARSEREISYSLEEDEEDEDADAVGKGASGTYEDELAFERYARQRFSNSTGHESTNGTGASTRPLGKQSTESLQQDVGSAGRPATRVDSIEEVRFKRDISRSLFKKIAKLASEIEACNDDNLCVRKLTLLRDVASTMNEVKMI